MNLKEILQKLRVKKNSIEGKYYVIEECELEVGITDDLLAVTLGQWMGMLYDSTKSSRRGVTIYSPIEPEEYLNKFGLSYEIKRDIEARFANILTKAGFTGEDICVLENFDADNLTFDATFFHRDDLPKLKIRFGTWLENGPELTVTNNTEVNLYNVWMGDKNTKDKVQLDYSIKILDNQGKKFARSVSPYSYRASLYNKENKLTVTIVYPLTLDLESGINPMINEEEMEEILSDVEFPINIEELTSMMTKAFKLDVNSYPKINIIISKKNDKGKDVVTDEVKFENGKFTSLKLTKNGKTISIDEFDSWTYSTNDYSITQSKDNNISYAHKSMPIDQFEAMPSPTELVNNANTDVEEVKGIALTLFKK